MGRYDEDIESNQYLNEHGKYAMQFARNHGISIAEAYKHPTVIAHRKALNHLNECFLFAEGLMKGDVK